MDTLAWWQLISLMSAVAIIAATGGYIYSAVARRNKRRSRGYFALGFLSGALTVAMTRNRRRRIRMFRAAMTRPSRSGWSW
jgi:hypothetical protein